MATTAITTTRTREITSPRYSTKKEPRRVTVGSLATVIKRMDLKTFAIAVASVGAGIVIYQFLEPKVIENETFVENVDDSDNRHYLLAAGLLWAAWKFRKNLPVPVTFGLVGGAIASAAKPLIARVSGEEEEQAA